MSAFADFLFSLPGIGLLLGDQGRRPKIQASDTANPAQWLIDWVRGGAASATGEAVSPDSAMRVGAVFSCVRVVSEDVAKLPLVLYRRLPKGGKERAVDHPLFKILGGSPNPRQTSFEFREWAQACLELRGNAYIEIERDYRGRVVALWPRLPTKIIVKKDPDGDLWYCYQPDRMPERIISQENMLHLRGLSVDGDVGLSVVSQAREAIGMAIAAERYGAMFFKNDAQPRGVLMIPEAASDKARQNIEESFQKEMSGKKRHSVPLLEEGIKYLQIGMSNEDAQFLQTRGLQREEIAAMWRVPQHKIGILTRTTFSNIEQQALEYVSDSLLPRLRRNEQRYEHCLLTEAERGEYFIEHMVDGLLRADIVARYGAYQIAFINGWMNDNEIREKENMNPRDGGDEYRVPANTLPSGTDPNATKTDEPPATPAAKRKGHHAPKN